MPLPCFATQSERLLPSYRQRHSGNPKAGSNCQYMVLCEPLKQYPSHVLASAAGGQPCCKEGWSCACLFAALLSCALLHLWFPVCLKDRFQCLVATCTVPLELIKRE